MNEMNSEFPSVARSISVLERLMKMYYDSELSAFGISWGQMFPLEVIAANPGITPQALAEILHIDRAAVTKSVRKLVQIGLIASARDEKDRRSYHLSITDDAREPLAAIRKAHSGFSSAITEDMTPTEAEHLTQMLKQVSRKLALQVNHRWAQGKKA